MPDDVVEIPGGDEEPEEPGDAASGPGRGSFASTYLSGQINPAIFPTFDTSAFDAITKNAELFASIGRTIDGLVPKNLDHITQAVSAVQAAMPVMDSLAGINSVIAGLAKYSANWPTLSRATDYAKPDPPKSAYSPQMEGPESYFGPSEIEINSFDDLHNEITKLIGKTPSLPLVWRGVRRASWGLHSHLYRQLMRVNKVVPPEKKPKREQRYPDENQMVAAEREILRTARDDWRFDNMSALETFARIQHAGGPTRLIDVTLNPYVAAWFAVEANDDDNDHDARLFAIATRPVEKEGKPPAGDSSIHLDAVGAGRDPFWHLLDTPAKRQQWDWGTGARRRLWVPPAYDPRISAQNAAFVLDGVPITSMKTASYFTIEHNIYWRRADLLAASSIYLKMHSPRRKPQYNSRNFAPTFSFKIAADKKAEIREYLESRFGYRRSYIYPDMAALAEHLKSQSLAEV
ncbi:MAG: FRG domain-containing protein [Protaetiibacter sp.]